MTEFMFCPRAGLILYEQQTDDSGEEQPARPTPLDYVPRYNMDAINRALNAEFQSWWKAAWRPALLATALGWSFLSREELWLMFGQAVDAATRLSLFAPMLMFFGCMIATPPLLVFVFARLLPWVFDPTLRAIDRVAELNRCRLAAESAEPVIPDVRDRPVEVNWWSLLKAGFDSISYHDKDLLQDSELRLSGRPWRVIRHGSLRIPVFRKGKCDGPNGRRLYPQHFARIAAYCQLLQTSEAGECPYGIILFGHTFEGFAVPIGRKTDQALKDGLFRARSTIKAHLQLGREPAPPRTTGRCGKCPHGYPRVFRDSSSLHQLRGAEVQLYGSCGGDKRTYHSLCGDRFLWCPPHDRAFEKELFGDPEDDDWYDDDDDSDY